MIQKPFLKSSRVNGLMAKFSRKKIVVFGDVGIDQYTVGKVSRISPEAPIPIVEVTQVSHKLGLAANVADNVVALGGGCHLVGLIGKDNSAKVFEKLLKERGLPVSYLVHDRNRPTTLKERVVAESQQVVRIDHEIKSAISGKLISEVESRLERAITGAHCIIIEDYAKGLVTSGLCQAAVRMAAKKDIPVLVDPNSKTPLKIYRGCTLVTPNTSEAEALTGVTIDSPGRLREAGRVLLEELGAPYAIITRGKDGMAIFIKGQKEPVLMPTFAREVYDVSGAGDTVIATLALALISGGDILEAALLANFAAGVEVGKRGTATVSQSELKEYIKILTGKRSATITSL